MALTKNQLLKERQRLLDAVTLIDSLIKNYDEELARESLSIPYMEEAQIFIAAHNQNRSFKIENFMGFLKEKYPDAFINLNSIRGPFRKLTEDEVIHVYEAGVGNKPNIYKIGPPKFRKKSTNFDHPIYPSNDHDNPHASDEPSPPSLDFSDEPAD